MSFILDALRKSEAERQDGRPPGLADVRRAAPRGRARLWAPLALLVLLANLLLLWLIWRGQAVAPAVIATPPTPPPALASTGNAAPTTPAAAAPAQLPEAAPEPPREVRPLARETLPRTVATPAPPPPAAPAAQPGTSTPIPAAEELSLPRFEELVGSGRLNLPPLALELHVWSDQPGSRFVFINSARYREGERLAEGPLVEQITSGGVVLSQGGERFVLLRP